MKRGLYRVHGIAGQPDDVRIDDDGIEMPVEERLYRARGYLPPVDQLPWQEVYFGAQQSSESSVRTKENSERAARDRARQEFSARFRKS